MPGDKPASVRRPPFAFNSIYLLNHFNIVHLVHRAEAKQTGAGLSLAEAQKILGLRPPYELKEVTKVEECTPHLSALTQRHTAHIGSQN